nr:glycosyltransferase [Anaerolineae bacterium]
MESDTRALFTCILTLQAARPGGIPTVDDWWYRFLTGWGHQAVVLYAVFEGEGVTRWQRLKQTLRTWAIHPRPEHPNPTYANAPLPVPLWLMYWVPQWLTGSLWDQFNRIVVSGGPCLHALPLALLRQDYVVWLGTLYEDELRGKAMIHDEWAQRVLQNCFWPFLAWQERLVLRRARHILAQSPYTLRRVVESIPGAAGKTTLAMVPVDTNQFKPAPDKANNDLSGYILNVSRFNDPRKNTALLLEAFAQVRKQHPAIKLVLAGDTPEEPVLNLVDQLNLKDAVIFKGRLETNALVDLYQRASLFVISSTQEGLGIVMLEAMACGTPVIATDCGGPEGIVQDGLTGRLVRNNDQDKLAETISDLLDDPDTLKQMAKKCVLFIEENCSPGAVEQIIHQHMEAASTAGSEPVNEPKVRWALAAAWAVIVFAAYMVHQWIIHGPAVLDQILQPLADTLR